MIMLYIKENIMKTKIIRTYSIEKELFEEFKKIAEKRSINISKFISKKISELIEEDVGRTGISDYIEQKVQKAKEEIVLFGVLQKVEDTTHTGRIYPKDVFDKELDLSEEKERVIKSLLSKDLNSELNSELNNIDRGTDA